MNWLIVLLALVAIFLLVRLSKQSQAPKTCGAWNLQYPCHLNGPNFQEPRSSYWEFQQPMLNYKYF